jgi:hypothetical protein
MLIVMTASIRRRPLARRPIALGLLALLLVAAVVAVVVLLRPDEAKPRAKALPPPPKAGSTAPSPSPSHHPNTFDYVDLGPGDCFDAPQFSTGLTKVVKKPCTGPHDAEVTGLTELPPGLHGAGEMLAQALPLCRPVTQPVYDRLAMDKRVLTSAALYPDTAAYATGRRTLTCALGAAEARAGKKLTAPLN